MFGIIFSLVIYVLKALLINILQSFFVFFTFLYSLFVAMQ